MAVITTYVPKVFEGEEAKYAGTVSLRLPTYIERISLMRDVDMCGEDNLLRLITMARALPLHFQGADITRREDAHKFTTWSDLESESGLSEVITEMTIKLLGESKAGPTKT
jgi:hypothetical protein